MSDDLFSTFNSEYFSQIIFFNLRFTYFAINNLYFKERLFYFTIMTRLEKNRFVRYLGLSDT